MVNGAIVPGARSTPTPTAAERRAQQSFPRDVRGRPLEEIRAGQTLRGGVTRPTAAELRGVSARRQVERTAQQLASAKTTQSRDLAIVRTDLLNQLRTEINSRRRGLDRNQLLNLEREFSKRARVITQNFLNSLKRVKGATTFSGLGGISRTLIPQTLAGVSDLRRDRLGGTISLPSLGKSFASRLSSVGIRPDVRGSLDKIERDIQLLTTKPTPTPVTKITTPVRSPLGAGTGITVGEQFRPPNITDIGKGILSPQQEAEIKSEDIFIKFSEGKLTQSQVETKLKKIEKDFNLAETKRQLLATVATGLGIGAVSAIAPPLGLALGGFFGIQAFRNRGEIRTFAKQNPKAAAIQFSAGLGGVGIGAGGVSGFRAFRQGRQFTTAKPKIELLSGKSKNAVTQTIIEQIEPEFQLLQTKGDITGVKNYKVKVPTSQGTLEVLITEFEKNGLKQFIGTEKIAGEIRPVFIRGQSIVKGQEGLSQIITRVARISQKDEKARGIVLGRGSPTKFNIELRELIERVKLERTKKFKEDLLGRKLTTREISILKSEVREATTTRRFLTKLRSTTAERISAGEKVSIKKIPIGFQKDVVKKLILKGVNPKLAERFATNNLFSKADIANRLKVPFTKSQFEKAIRLNDSRFLFERKLTDIEISGKTIGGNQKRLSITKTFFERGKTIPKGKRIIKIKKGEFKAEVPLVRAVSEKAFRGTGVPKKPFQSVSKFKVKRLIQPVPKRGRGTTFRERQILETVSKAKFKVKRLFKDIPIRPSPVGTFAEIAKASAKGIEKQAFKSRVTKGITRPLFGVGLPRAVGGLGRDLGTIPLIGIGRPRITISQPEILSLSKSLPISKLSTTQIQNIQFKTKQGISPLLSSITKLSIKQRSLIKQGIRLSTSQLQNLKLTSVEAVKVRLATRLAQQQLQQLKLKQRATTQQRGFQTPKIKFPLKPKPLPTDLKDFGSRVTPIGTPPKNTPGYNAFVKQRKKFIKVNQVPITKNKARDLASFVTDRSLAATWKIKKSKKFAQKPVKIIPPRYFDRNKDKFRSFKRKKGIRIPITNSAIERRTFRLDSRSEVNKINVARFSKQISRRIIKPFKPNKRIKLFKK